VFWTLQPKSYIFLELVTGGDLFGYVNRNKKLDENEAKFISYQLALALEVSTQNASSLTIWFDFI
jgi:serine/threonine protein kinase